MPYMIRTRDGVLAGTHRGDLRGINVPDGEASERFDSRDDFEARLAELAPPPGPDVNGLLDAAFDALGKPQARSLARDYPDLTIALERRNWQRARDAIDAAHTDGALSDAQHQAVIDLAAQHNVPLAQ